MQPLTQLFFMLFIACIVCATQDCTKIEHNLNCSEISVSCMQQLLARDKDLIPLLDKVTENNVSKCISSIPKPVFENVPQLSSIPAVYKRMIKKKKCSWFPSLFEPSKSFTECLRKNEEMTLKACLEDLHIEIFKKLETSLLFKVQVASLPLNVERAKLLFDVDEPIYDQKISQTLLKDDKFIEHVKISQIKLHLDTFGCSSLKYLNLKLEQLIGLTQVCLSEEFQVIFKEMYRKIDLENCDALVSKWANAKQFQRCPPPTIAEIDPDLFADDVFTASLGERLKDMTSAQAKKYSSCSIKVFNSLPLPVLSSMSVSKECFLLISSKLDKEHYHALNPILFKSLSMAEIDLSKMSFSQLKQLSYFQEKGFTEKLDKGNLLRYKLFDEIPSQKLSEMFNLTTAVGAPKEWFSHRNFIEYMQENRLLTNLSKSQFLEILKEPKNCSSLSLSSLSEDLLGLVTVECYTQLEQLCNFRSYSKFKPEIFSKLSSAVVCPQIMTLEQFVEYSGAKNKFTEANRLLPLKEIKHLWNDLDDSYFDVYLSKIQSEEFKLIDPEAFTLEKFLNPAKKKHLIEGLSLLAMDKVIESKNCKYLNFSLLNEALIEKIDSECYKAIYTPEICTDEKYKLIPPKAFKNLSAAKACWNQMTVQQFEKFLSDEMQLNFNQVKHFVPDLTQNLVSRFLKLFESDSDEIYSLLNFSQLKNLEKVKLSKLNIQAIAEMDSEYFSTLEMDLIDVEISQLPPAAFSVRKIAELVDFELSGDQFKVFQKEFCDLIDFKRLSNLHLNVLEAKCYKILFQKKKFCSKVDYKEINPKIFSSLSENELCKEITLKQFEIFGNGFVDYKVRCKISFLEHLFDELPFVVYLRHLSNKNEDTEESTKPFNELKQINEMKQIDELKQNEIKQVGSEVDKDQNEQKQDKDDLSIEAIQDKTQVYLVQESLKDFPMKLFAVETFLQALQYVEPSGLTREQFQMMDCYFLTPRIIQGMSDEAAKEMTPECFSKFKSQYSVSIDSLVSQFVQKYKLFNLENMPKHLISFSNLSKEQKTLFEGVATKSLAESVYSEIKTKKQMEDLMKSLNLSDCRFLDLSKFSVEAIKGISAECISNFEAGNWIQAKSVLKSIPKEKFRNISFRNFPFSLIKDLRKEQILEIEAKFPSALFIEDFDLPLEFYLKQDSEFYSDISPKAVAKLPIE